MRYDNRTILFRFIKTLNPLMAKEGGGGGGGGMDATPQQVFQFFLRMGRAFIPNKIFSFSLILEIFVHENKFQIGPTVLALKLDEGRMMGGGNNSPWTFLYLFF